MKVKGEGEEFPPGVGQYYDMKVRFLRSTVLLRVGAKNSPFLIHD